MDTERDCNRGRKQSPKAGGGGVLRSRGAAWEGRREIGKMSPNALRPHSRPLPVVSGQTAETSGKGRVTEPKRWKYINNISLRGGKARSRGSSSSHSNSLCFCPVLG